jgi:hypothetical protein
MSGVMLRDHPARIGIDKNVRTRHRRRSREREREQDDKPKAKGAGSYKIHAAISVMRFKSIASG